MTCTFAPEENEAVVSDALDRLPIDLEPISLPVPHAPGLTEFDGQGLASVAKGELDLGKLRDEDEEQAAREVEGEHKDFVQHIQEVLADDVKEVRISHRLTDSPSCLVLEEHEMAVHLQQVMKQAGHSLPDSKPILEVNPDHALVRRLKDEQDQDRFAEWSHLLFEQAMLSEGGQLEDPSTFVKRMNAILVEMSGN